MKFLLEEAIAQFGYAARDVFLAVFDYNWVADRHLSAFNLNIQELRSVVDNLMDGQNLLNPISHRIFAISPVGGGSLVNVKWTVNFKSVWVAKKIGQRLTVMEERNIADTIAYFRNIPRAQDLAGWLFEPLAHRKLSEAGAESGEVWRLFTMRPDDTEPDAPRFTLTPEAPCAAVKLTRVHRDVVEVTTPGVDGLDLANDRYYIPTDPTFPLFDSFAVELNVGDRSGILWVFQITTSRRHGGSGSGYQKVRRIVAKLKKRLDHDVIRPKKRRKVEDGVAEPTVEVRYVLVVPESEGESTSCTWKFPPGWQHHRKRHDHRGNVYCLKLPLIVRPSLISTNHILIIVYSNIFFHSRISTQCLPHEHIAPRSST